MTMPMQSPFWSDYALIMQNFILIMYDLNLILLSSLPHYQHKALVQISAPTGK